ASRLLESRLAASRAQIASLTSSNSGSLDASRLEALRAEQRQTLRLCEGLYRLSMDDEDGETKPAKTAKQQLRKSVAFQETKTSSTPASDAFIRSSLAELRSLAELEAAKPPQQPSTTTQKSRSRDDLDATEGETAVRRRYQELLRSRVKAMWSDFDVAGARESPGGWHRRRRSASLDGSLEGSGGARKTKPAPAAASTSTLGRTIPEPFSMTLRESTAGPASLRKSRSLLQFEAERRRQRDEEEAACRVRFHASPVPAHVRMPLFEELSEQQQARRKEIRERSQERLKEIERPFSFASESAARPEAPRSSAAAPAAAADFRARPVPPTSSSGEAVRARQQLREEDELLRQIRIRMRSEELLGRSATPGEMADRQRRMEELRKSRLAAKYGEVDDGKAATSSKQKQQKKQKKKSQLAGADPPDFKRLHWSFGQELLTSSSAAVSAAGGRVATRTKPFKLRTEQRLQRRPGSAPQAASTAASLNIPAPMKSSAKSAMLREARRDAERQAEERRRRQTRSTTTRRQAVQRELAESVRASVSLAAAGSGPSISERTREKLEAQREQEEAYKQRLQEIKEKMKQRDLLVVQQAKLIAQQRAQAKYRKTLEEAGLDPKEVDENAKQYQEGDLQSYTQEFEEDYERDSPAAVSEEDEEVSDRVSSGSGGELGATTRAEAAVAE
uniref:TPX2 domain-containing protein n=1 Tax=Macrostomum lignano TaxID=282301 RepID=A0A1I8HLD7_9PLAT